MFLTEEDAKTKLCPLAKHERTEFQFINGQSGGVIQWIFARVKNLSKKENNYMITKAVVSLEKSDVETAYYCVGSVCMLWRWSNLSTKDKGFCGLHGRNAPE